MYTLFLLSLVVLAFLCFILRAVDKRTALNWALTLEALCKAIVMFIFHHITRILVILIWLLHEPRHFLINSAATKRFLRAEKSKREVENHSACNRHSKRFTDTLLHICKAFNAKDMNIVAGKKEQIYDECISGWESFHFNFEFRMPHMGVLI